jgi:nicotinamide-nucleotide amidase
VSRTVRAEIVGVGTELLLGQIANTNAQWMGERLSAIGVDVLHHQVVGDNLGRIVEALRLSLARADVVLVTGGLGPTEDDITRDAIAELLGEPMVRRDEIERFLRDRFAGFAAGEMPSNNLRQADVPRGARYIMPEIGSAPGLIAELRGGERLYAMPGVPAEMVEMMERVILPELEQMVGGAIVRSRTLRCVGIGESRVAEILADLFASSTNPSLAYLASAGEVKVRITAKAATAGDADAMIAPLADIVANRLGDAVFTRDDESLEQAVIRLLRASDGTVACAESLTGGGVSARLTSVPGASAVFAGAAVVYTVRTKREILGVSEETIRGPGVVSRECALEMAAGARRLFDADLAISLTGAAGPEPHDGAEPGTTWLGLAGEGLSYARGYTAPGERERVRRWAEQAALDLLRRQLERLPLPESDRII